MLLAELLLGILLAQHFKVLLVMYILVTRHQSVHIIGVKIMTILGRGEEL